MAGMVRCSEYLFVVGAEGTSCCFLFALVASCCLLLHIVAFCCLLQVQKEPLLLEAFGPCLPSSSEKGVRFRKTILDSGVSRQRVEHG